MDDIVIKSIKQENSDLIIMNTSLEDELYNLKEENRKLKKYYDYEKEELADSCYDFNRENDKLKARVKELEECNINLQNHIDKSLN